MKTQAHEDMMRRWGLEDTRSCEYEDTRTQADDDMRRQGDDDVRTCGEEDMRTCVLSVSKGVIGACR